MATSIAVWSERVGALRLRFHENGGYSVTTRGRDHRQERSLSLPRGRCGRCSGRAFCRNCDSTAYEITLELERNLRGGKGLLLDSEVRQVVVDTVPAIAKGIEDYIAQEVEPHATERHVADYRYSARLFVRWLAEAKPHVETFEDLNRDIIQAYINAGLAGWPGKRQYSVATIRSRLHPIRIASTRLSERYPGRVLPINWRSLRIPRQQRPVGVIDVWSIEELVFTVRSMAASTPSLAPAFAVSAFTGARLKESVYLRLRDVDLEAGTITITDTGLHATKTQSSKRTIPVVPVLVEILRAQVERRKEQKAGPDSTLVVGCRNGRPIAEGAISARFTAAIALAQKEWEKLISVASDKPDDFPRLDRIPPRKARASFSTAAVRAGIAEGVVAAYDGHAPQTILARHYLQRTVEDLRIVPNVLGPIIAECWAKPIAELIPAPPGNVRERVTSIA